MNAEQFHDEVLGAASLWLQGYSDPIAPDGPQYRIRLLQDTGTQGQLVFEATQMGGGVVNGHWRPNGTTSRFQVKVEVTELPRDR